MRVLLLNQAFHPDVVSTAQHASDLAVALVERGHSVTVIASARGYDRPSWRFPKRECWKGVDIIRVRGLGLGKAARWRRVLDFASFMLACAFRLLIVPKPDLIVALTSPPLISVLAGLAAKLRGARYAFWVMDLNPDEAIAAGWVREGSRTARVLSMLSRLSLKSADRIIVLDRFMRERVLKTGVEHNKLEVIPPWSHDAVVAYDQAGGAVFRQKHKLEGKFVVMYAGNHSPCHPLDTLLQTALSLKDHSDIAFCFVGGGSEFGKVKRFAEIHRLASITCIGYQPLEQLSAMLSAADLHVVVMGDEFVGIVHPCKIYNVLAIGKPVLYIGPAPSHVTDLFSELDRGAFASVAHGDAVRAEEAIERFSRNLAVSAKDGSHITARRSMNIILGQMVTVLESVHADRAALGVTPELRSES